MAQPRISLPSEFFKIGKTIKIECIGYYKCDSNFNDDQANVRVLYNDIVILQANGFNMMPSNANATYAWKLEVWMTLEQFGGCSMLNTFNATGIFSWTTILASNQPMVWYAVGLIALADTITTGSSSNDIYPDWTWFNNSGSTLTMTNQACTVMN